MPRLLTQGNLSAENWPGNDWNGGGSMIEMAAGFRAESALCGPLHKRGGVPCLPFGHSDPRASPYPVTRRKRGISASFSNSIRVSNAATGQVHACGTR